MAKLIEVQQTPKSNRRIFVHVGDILAFPGLVGRLEPGSDSVEHLGRYSTEGGRACRSYFFNPAHPSMLLFRAMKPGLARVEIPIMAGANAAAVDPGSSAAVDPSSVFEIVVYRGIETQPGEFPECGLIGTRFNTGDIEWIASGVLIAPTLMLTARHVLALNPNVIALDTIVLSPDRRVVGGELISVSAFESSNIDLAVLVLRTAASTRPAVLPASVLKIDPDERLTIVGFGHNDVRQVSGFGIQRKADISVLQVNGTEFVAGGGNEGDTCTGDSGGPAYLSDNTHTVVGITSRGVQEHDCGAGGVYTSVVSCLPFIQDVINRRRPNA